MGFGMVEEERKKLMDQEKEKGVWEEKSRMWVVLAIKGKNREKKVINKSITENQEREKWGESKSEEKVYMY